MAANYEIQDFAANTEEKKKKKTRISKLKFIQTTSGMKRKLSRKEERRDLRNQKKAKKHSFFSTKSGKKDIKKSELEEVLPEKVKRKKKKKKRKRTNQGETEDDFQTEPQNMDIYEDNDDNEIEELELKLNLKKKSKIPNAFFEDGLGDILDMCSAIEAGTLKSQMENYADDEDVDNAAIHHGFTEQLDDLQEDTIDSRDVISANDDESADIDVESEDEYEEESEDKYEEETYGKSSEANREDEKDKNEERNSEEEKWKQDESSSEEDQIPQQLTRSQDIYGGATAKYVPPHQRHNQSDHIQTNERLKKQVKGLLNRLSESNISTVSGQLEELYMSNSRNELNMIISDLLMEACVSPSLMPEGLLREHIMLIAVLNSLIGSEVGSFLLQKLAVQFKKFHSASEDGNNDGKEINNIVTLLAFLYSFKVIDCALIYDIFRELVAKFHEKDIELLLLLIKHVGVEIRRESPESLKEIILVIQAKAVSDPKMTTNSRTKFMLETIVALRNNNIRKIPNYDPAPVERARKILKSIAGVNEDTKLSISLSDLLSAGEKGRWWVVGSAWSEREKEALKDDSVMSYNSKVIELSRKQRMNTDVRRNIFCTVMTSEDYVDAFEKLMRLKLKDKQSREIIHVLLDCSLQEKSYNPFYSYLIQKFCEFSRSFQVTVQYSLWDRFKMVATLTDENFLNMAHLMVHLFITKSLSLSVLKVVDFTSLDTKLVQFFTEMLTHILLDYPETTIREVFSRIAPIVKLDTLKESLKLFMKHFMKPKKLSSSNVMKKSGKMDKTAKLQERINIAVEALSGGS
ncbi:nucleolar MIF4G domain-containing protein 1-like [Dendronephthya gigantea]|uniref:nucleolar MIF4G domain-containing protein 1-like n=1 Tax=Dendronephthya gigantea TaxID=151771 RepID=UPI001069BC4F|nr:nucleolar MIF4G domain-containing protein 1-like [Dendronephthya gigantea]XP_028404671.1 nucleolar MIF4G domain-containing protein 1-like [Dendronephthya gigantea]